MAASAFAPSPAGIVAFTIAVEGSTRDTVPSRWFATQIDSNAESTAVGPFPVSLYVSVTVRFVGSAGSTRATPAGATATHTPFGVKATPEGRPASCTVLGSSLEFGSSLMSSAVMESVIQSAPSPNAIPEGAVPTGISSVTSPVPGSIRMTVPSPALVTHTEPSPIAMPAGDAADLDVRIGDRAVLEAHACHDSLVRLGHPQAPEADRRRAGPLAQRRGIEIRGSHRPRSTERSSSSQRR